MESVGIVSAGAHPAAGPPEAETVKRLRARLEAAGCAPALVFRGPEEGVSVTRLHWWSRYREELELSVRVDAANGAAPTFHLTLRTPFGDHSEAYCGELGRARRLPAPGRPGAPGP